MIHEENLHAGWEVVELAGILHFETKSKHRASDGKEDGKYKFFTSSGIQSKYINDFTFDGEYLIFSTGGNASIHYCNEKFSISADCLVAKVKDRSICTKYVYYYLVANIYLLEAGFKGAGLKHISKTYINKIKFSYPTNLETQKKIVSTLEKAEKAKQLRKEADGLTKDYFNSLFLEMFGDPLTNPKRWDLVKFDDLCNEIYRYPSFYGFKYVPNGFPVLKISDMTENGIFSEKTWLYDHISEEISQKYPRTKVETGDIVMEARGTYIGKCGMVPPALKGAHTSPNTLRISPNRGIVLPKFLLYLSFTNAWKVKIEQLARYWKAGFGTIKAQEIKKMKIPLPPLTLQRSFVGCVRSITDIRSKQDISKQQLDDLFNSLMQKAFRGELVP